MRFVLGTERGTQQNCSRFRGFTLIELLVVISIIGMLSSVLLSSLNEARSKSRDARRSGDLYTIRTALELYYSDNGHYPIMATTWTSFDAPSYAGNAITNPSAATLAAALAPYLPSGMADPRRISANTGLAANDAGYLYRSLSTVSGDSYCILFFRTPENMFHFSSSLIPMNRCLSVGLDGMCTGANALYYGTGTFAGGC